MCYNMVKLRRKEECKMSLHPKEDIDVLAETAAAEHVKYKDIPKLKFSKLLKEFLVKKTPMLQRLSKK